MRYGADTRGSVSVEMAILLPAFLLLLFAAIWFGRIAIAANAIDVAAHDAARAASISRTEAEAAANLEAAAQDALAQQSLNCAEDPEIVPELGGFDLDTLELTTVEVVITCQVSFEDIAFFGLPDTWEITSSFRSPIDTFRERQ